MKSQAVHVGARAGVVLLVTFLAGCGTSSTEKEPAPTHAHVKGRSVQQDEDGLLAHYTFDSKEPGAIGHDASGRNHHVTVGEQTVAATGRFGSALSCSGLSAFTLPAATFASPSSQLTLAAWIKPAVNQYAPILEFSADAFHYGPHLWVTQQGGVYMNFWGSPGNDRVVQTVPGSIPAAVWTHVACTYDGSNALVYVNGQAAGAEQWPGLRLEIGYPFSVGARKGWGHGNALFGGLIDEVVVYDRVLSADALRQLAAP